MNTDSTDKKLQILEDSNPVSSDLGITRRLKNLGLTNKIASLVESITDEAEGAELEDKIKALGVILKVRQILSKDPAYLMELVRNLSEKELSLVSSYLEQNNIKKGFVENKLDAKTVFKG